MKISIRLKKFDGLNAESKHLVYIMLQPFKYGYSVLFANTFLRDKKIRTSCFFISGKLVVDISIHRTILLEKSYYRILDYLVSFQHIITILIYNTTR